MFTNVNIIKMYNYK